jgi:AcrR family transcriptional regulator
VGTEQTILDATLEVVSRVGLARLALDDVARQAQVSRQTVYRYFGSRDGLVRAVILREEAALVERLVNVSRRHRDARAAMEAAVREALHAAREHPLLTRLLASEPEALLPYLLAGDSPVLSAARPVVTDLLARFAPHLTERELEALSDVTTRLLMSYVVSPPAASCDELAVRIADLVVNSIKS